MKLNKFTLTLLLAMLAVSSCKKNDQDNNSLLVNERPYGDESLSEEQNEFLEGIGIPADSADFITGIDEAPLKTTGATLKKDLLNKFLSKGKELIKMKSTYNNSEGEDKPGHYGFAYSRGQRNLTQRLKPTEGDKFHTKYYVFGTDCSGFIYNIINSTDLQTSNFSVVSFQNTLSKAIDGSSKYGDLALINLGKIPTNEIKIGDFIIWNDNDHSHMGIVCGYMNGLAIMQSNGTGYPGSEANQTKNLGLGRGVRLIRFKQAISTPFFGNNFEVIRIVETGDTLQGGLLFYLSDDRKSGLVCAPEDQANAISWSAGNNIWCDVKIENLGAGKSNTQKIVTTLGGGNYAAKLCFDLVLNGYDDWFLPSMNECNYMQARLYNNGKGNIAPSQYWTSTEASNLSALCWDYSKNTYVGNSKNDPHKVRAIREIVLH